MGDPTIYESQRQSWLGPVLQRPRLILGIIALVAWLPGFFTLPPLDRDEARFAQASKQMLETGDFVSIRLGEDSRDQKPVGIYWLQAASTAMLSPLLQSESSRQRIWTYRVPSLLGGIAALILTFGLVRVFASVETAFLSALLLASTVLLMAEAKIAKTDAVLLATILAAQVAAMRVYLAARGPDQVAAPSARVIYGGWAAFGFGLLVKGPIIALVCGATIVAVSLWDRDWRWLKRLHAGRGLLLAVAIALPWAIAIGIVTDGAFYAGSLGQDFASKLAGGQESHGAPPGTHAALVFITFWPAALVLLPALVHAVGYRHQPVVRYLLVWAATTWLMFEATPTKLPHYVLPAFPALAILGAMWVTAVRDSSEQAVRKFGRGLGERMAIFASCGLFLMVAAALAGGLLWAPGAFGRGPAIWTYGAAAMGLGIGLVAMVALWRGSRVEAVGAATLSAIVLYAMAWFGTAPALDAFLLSPRIAEASGRHALPGDPALVLAGYAEPSALFLLGTETVLATGETAGEIASRSDGLFVVEDRERAAFLAAVAAPGGRSAARLMALEEIEGTNYSNGRELSLTLYRVDRVD